MKLIEILNGKVNSESRLLGKSDQKSIKEKVHNFLDSLKSKATKLSTKTKALMASVFSLSFLTSISPVSASTGTIVAISAAIPVVGWVATGVVVGATMLGGLIRKITTRQESRIYNLKYVGDIKTEKLSSMVLIKEISDLVGKIGKNEFIDRYSKTDNINERVSLILELTYHINKLSIDDQIKQKACTACFDFLRMTYTYRSGSQTFHKQPLIETKSFRVLFGILVDIVSITQNYNDLSRILELTGDNRLEISSEQYLMLGWLILKNQEKNPKFAKSLYEKLNKYYNENVREFRELKSGRRENADLKDLTHLIRYGLLIEQVGFDSRTLNPLEDHWHLGLICKFLSSEQIKAILENDFDIHYITEESMEILLEKLALIAWGIHHSEMVPTRESERFNEVKEIIEYNRKVIKDLIATEGSKEITIEDIPSKFKEQFKGVNDINLLELIRRINYLRKHGDRAFLKEFFPEYYHQIIELMGNYHFLGTHYLGRLNNNP